MPRSGFRVFHSVEVNEAYDDVHLRRCWLSELGRYRHRRRATCVGLLWQRRNWGPISWLIWARSLDWFSITPCLSSAGTYGTYPCVLDPETTTVGPDVLNPVVVAGAGRIRSSFLYAKPNSLADRTCCKSMEKCFAIVQAPDWNPCGDTITPWSSPSKVGLISTMRLWNSRTFPTGTRFFQYLHSTRIRFLESPTDTSIW